MKRLVILLSMFAAFAGYADALELAWIKGKTDKNPLFYKKGETMVFTYVCPPSGLAILWNNIKSNKDIRWVQGSQHGYIPPENYEGRDFKREVK